MAQARTARSTQDFVPVREIRDGVVVLMDGSLRAVLMASSLNFGLKSSDEQDSIIFQFQNFLNSLDFPIQFYIQSRELDIRPYIALMEEQYKAQLNDLLKIQTLEYIKFIQAFTENNNIMSKSFFVIVGYTPPIVAGASSSGLSGILNTLSGSSSKKEDAKELSDELFEESKTQLIQRLNVIEQGLTRTGVRVIQLGTEELTEMYYNIFNLGNLQSEIKPQN